MTEEKKNKLLMNLWVFCANMVSVYTKKTPSEKQLDALIAVAEENKKPFIGSGLESYYDSCMTLMFDRITETWRSNEKGKNR